MSGSVKTLDRIAVDDDILIHKNTPNNRLERILLYCDFWALPRRNEIKSVEEAVSMLNLHDPDLLVLVAGKHTQNILDILRAEIMRLSYNMAQNILIDWMIHLRIQTRGYSHGLDSSRILLWKRSHPIISDTYIYIYI